MTRQNTKINRTIAKLYARYASLGSKLTQLLSQLELEKNKTEFTGIIKKAENLQLALKFQFTELEEIEPGLAKLDPESMIQINENKFTFEKIVFSF